MKVISSSVPPARCPFCGAAAVTAAVRICRVPSRTAGSAFSATASGLRSLTRITLTAALVQKPDARRRELTDGPVNPSDDGEFHPASEHTGNAYERRVLRRRQIRRATA